LLAWSAVAAAAATTQKLKVFHDDYVLGPPLAFLVLPAFHVQAPFNE
jgi:hypothetical protein